MYKQKYSAYTISNLLHEGLGGMISIFLIAFRVILFTPLSAQMHLPFIDSV